MAVAITAAMQNQVAQNYIAILGRNPDPLGFAFWVQTLADANNSPAAQTAIVNGFGNSAEFRATYASDTTSVAVGKLYQNVLLRAADAGGLAYWTNYANDLIASGQTISNAYAQTGAQMIYNAASQGNSDAAGIIARTATAVASGTAAPTTVYTLSTNTETISGPNITVNGLMDFGAGTALTASSTLNASDTITGTGGTNSLNVNITGGNAGTTFAAANISGIQNFNVRNVSGQINSLDAATVTGLTNYNSNLSSSENTVTNLASGASGSVTGNGSLTNGASNFGYVAGATASVLNIANGVTAGTVTLSGTGITAATINSTGAANTVGTLALAATTTGLTINAATGLTSAGVTGAALRTITVTGAASTAATPATPAANDITSAVQLGTLAATVTTVNASAMTAGGISATLVAAVTSLRGGAGTDTITTVGLTSTTASIIDAGAGTDVLRIAATGNVDTAAKGAQYAGFETLDAVATTVNMSNFANSAFTAVRLGGNATFTNLTATQAANVTIYANSSGNFGLSGASNVGQIDTLSLTVSDGLTARNTITLGDITAADVEIININAVDNVTVTQLTQLSTLTGMTVTGGGNVNISTGAFAALLNASVNASALTGTFTVNASGATTNGLLITGSATGVNTFIGSNQADRLLGGGAADAIRGLTGNDVIQGGAGNDTIVGNRGTDTMTGGDGNDTFVIRTSDSYVYATAGTALVKTITGVANTAGGAAYTITVNINGVSVTTAAIATNGDATAMSNAIRTAIGTSAEASSYVTLNAADAATVTLTAAGAQALSVLTTVNSGNGTAAVTFTTATGASSGALTTDTITDLNLGGASSGTGVDTIQLTGLTASALTVQATSAIAGADLVTAVTALFNTGGALNATTNTVGIYTFGTDSYLIGNVGTSASAFGTANVIRTGANGAADLLIASDFIIKVTGFTGTLDASDFTFVA